MEPRVRPMPMEDEEEEECGSESQGSPFSGDDGFLGGTLSGEALARSLVDVQTANELGLVRSEVGRLRQKIKSMERERDNMVDNFRDTTKILLNRIKELEAELSETKSRPQTAAIIERIERPKQVNQDPRTAHAPQVLKIAEEPLVARAGADIPTTPVQEVSKCGNCGKPIPAGNLISHNLYCYSNNFRCAACDEVIHARDKESHLQEWTDPTRLMDAVSKRDMDTLQRIIEHGVELSTARHPKTRDTAMHIAARLGDVEVIGFCVACGVDVVDPVNARGETPLHIAAEVADLPAAKLLVELGANLNMANGRGETPLMLVCRRGAAQTAKYLVEMRADAEACTKLGDTPLQIAQRLGHQDTVLALCMAGAPLRSGTPSRSRGGSPLARQLPTWPASTAGAAGNSHGGTPAGYPPALPGAKRSMVSPNPTLAASEGRKPQR